MKDTSENSLNLPNRKWLRHGVPDEVYDANPAFFITICCKKRHMNQLANIDAWQGLEDSVKLRNQRGGWDCSLFLAMPDHVHFIVSFPSSVDMSKTIANWKRWIARSLKVDWQVGYHDHRLRSYGSSIQKRRYVLDNPLRANLVPAREDWSFVYDRHPEVVK